MQEGCGQRCKTESFSSCWFHLLHRGPLDWWKRKFANESDMNARDEGGKPFLLIGGQAVYFWATAYLAREPSLHKIHRFMCPRPTICEASGEAIFSNRDVRSPALSKL